MTAPRWSVVVPVIPAHMKYIKTLLKELSPAKDQIAEIIFCASSQTIESKKKLNEISNNSVFREVIVIESTQERVTAGGNRNLGWSRAIGEYVCFLDADDSYNPYMFSVFEHYFDSLGCDLILHDYFRFTPQFMLRIKRNIKKIKVVNSDVLIKETFGENQIADLNKPRQPDITNLILPKRVRLFHQIQHGHATVRKSVPVKYSIRPVGEDGEFAQNMLLSGFNVVYLPIRLSNYDRPTFSNLSRSTALRIIEILSRLKKIIKFWV